MSVNKFSLEESVRAVSFMEVLNKKLVPMLDPEDKHRGGYFVIAEDDPPPQNVVFCDAGITPNLIALVGEVPDEKRRKYYALAIEKAQRLILCYREHTNSEQSRDDRSQRFGGGVRFHLARGNNIVCSFSGHAGFADEALVYATGVLMKWIDLPDAFSLATGKANPIIARLLGA